MPLFPSEQKSWPRIQFILRQTCGEGCCFYFFSLYMSKKVMNRLTRLFAVLSIQFPMTSCLISASFIRSILYPNKVPWNHLNHWNQYTSPGLTPGFFFVPVLPLLHGHYLQLLFLIAVHVLRFWCWPPAFLASGSCRIFPAALPSLL